MKPEDKKILVGKIDILHYSVSDTQMQAILSLIRDTVNAIQDQKDEVMGFTKK